MAGLRKRAGNESEVPVHGVAYLLNNEDFVRVIISEGYVQDFITHIREFNRKVALGPRTRSQI